MYLICTQMYLVYHISKIDFPETSLEDFNTSTVALFGGLAHSNNSYSKGDQSDGSLGESWISASAPDLMSGW